MKNKTCLTCAHYKQDCITVLKDGEKLCSLWKTDIIKLFVFDILVNDKYIKKQFGATNKNECLKHILRDLADELTIDDEGLTIKILVSE